MRQCIYFSDINYGNTSTDHVSAKTDMCARYCQEGNSEKNLAHIWNFFDLNFLKHFLSDLYHTNTSTELKMSMVGEDIAKKVI